MSQILDQQAQAILRANDRGAYTIPSHGLYPYQWNWDSAFTAIGLASFDLNRAWTELETLAAQQWPDGMLPHIVFHQPDPGYYPGPDVWNTHRSPATSGYAQPPVAATAVRKLFELGPASALNQRRAQTLFARLLDWHRWFHAYRDPDRLGVIALAHPWESGRDNLPDWDAPLGQVDASQVDDRAIAALRRDTQHVDPAMRPTRHDYSRYIALVRQHSALDWNPEEIARQSPFWVADVAITAILLRADRDLLALAERFDETAAAEELCGWIARAEAGIERLWNPEVGAYTSLDLRSGRHSNAVTAGSLLVLYADAGDDQHRDALLDHLNRWLDQVAFAVPSFDPEHPRFDPIRYWRGPVWPVVNWLISDGLGRCGQAELAARVDADTRALIERGGFSEYYSPLTGDSSGGRAFSWTAAVWLDRFRDAPTH